MNNLNQAILTNIYVLQDNKIALKEKQWIDQNEMTKTVIHKFKTNPIFRQKAICKTFGIPYNKIKNLIYKSQTKLKPQDIKKAYETIMQIEIATIIIKNNNQNV